jgi:hypothetical protein
MVVVYRKVQGVFRSAAAFTRSNGRADAFEGFGEVSTQTWRTVKNLFAKAQDMPHREFSALFEGRRLKKHQPKKFLLKTSRKAKGPGLRFLSEQGRLRFFKGEKFRASPDRRNRPDWLKAWWLV